MRATMLALAAAALAGCSTANPRAPRIEPIAIDSSYSVILRRVKVIPPEQRASVRASEIQGIEALSCQHQAGDAPATPENAIQQLQVKADRLGGDAVLVQVCGAPEIFNLRDDCWSAIRCTGTAAKLQ